MNLSMIIGFVLFLLSCKGQNFEKVTFACGNSTVEIEISKIKERDEYLFIEGKSEIYITHDNVIIEFYCAGNYGPHISNKNRYIIVCEKNNSLRGIDKETNLYWRKDGNLIYSNCKAKDTTFYNKIFDTKVTVRK